ncbi:MAG TPA: hypothetical protein VFV54_06870 [Thermoanaerobaculia bacterium]|nr:hypothetical protein [Thermoanaerobaculia bacterium]
MRAPLAVAALSFALAAPGHACSLVSTPHALDPQEQKVDHKAPAKAEASLARIVRGKGPVPHDDGSVSLTSCDDIGSIVLALKSVPLDDRTPADKLGYRIVLVDGELPKGASLPTNATRDLTPENELTFFWSDGATDEQDPIDFALAVVAVDLAGNESEPSAPVRVRHSGKKDEPHC